MGNLTVPTCCSSYLAWPYCHRKSHNSVMPWTRRYSAMFNECRWAIAVTQYRRASPRMQASPLNAATTDREEIMGSRCLTLTSTLTLTLIRYRRWSREFCRRRCCRACWTFTTTTRWPCWAAACRGPTSAASRRSWAPSPTGASLQNVVRQ